MKCFSRLRGNSVFFQYLYLWFFVDCTYGGKEYVNGAVIQNQQYQPGPCFKIQCTEGDVKNYPLPCQGNDIDNIHIFRFCLDIFGKYYGYVLHILEIYLKHYRDFRPYNLFSIETHGASNCL